MILLRCAYVHCWIILLQHKSCYLFREPVLQPLVRIVINRYVPVTLTSQYQPINEMLTT